MERPEAHVLLIEDNPGDADLVRLRLVEGRPQLRVECVSAPVTTGGWPSLRYAPSVQSQAALSAPLFPDNGRTTRVALDPRQDLAYYQLGRLYLAMGEREKGQACLKMATELKEKRRAATQERVVGLK